MLETCDLFHSSNRMFVQVIMRKSVGTELNGENLSCNFESLTAEFAALLRSIDHMTKHPSKASASMEVLYHLNIFL